MAVPSAHRWHRLGVSCVQQREPWPDCPIPLRAPPRVPDPDPPGLHDRAPRWRKKLLKDSYNLCPKDVRRVTCGGLATALATVPSNSACLFNLAAPAPAFVLVLAFPPSRARQRVSHAQALGARHDPSRRRARLWGANDENMCTDV